jgi:hypothetical protein
MKITDLTVEVRDANLVRLGQLLPEDLVGFQAVLRKNDIGSWKCTLPVGHRLAEQLRLPGAGIIVSFAQGTLLSGPTTSVITNQSIDDYEGTYEISGVDDSVILKERLAYPTPSTADVTAQTTAYDVRTGAASDVMKEYVNVNIGAAAPAARRVPQLSIDETEPLGPTVTGSARFETLQELLTALADVSDLGFTVEQVGSNLKFQVYEPVDRSANVRLDLQNGRLNKSEYAYSQPLVTRTIVGGSGDAEARVFIERSSADSLDAEAAWNRRIEIFNDSRSTTDLTELQQAGDEVLANDGKTIVSVSISPSDDQTMLFGVDWNLGDKVTVVVGPVELVSVVTEVGVLISADGVRVGATVGEPRTLDYETQILTRQKQQTSRISQLERSK